MTATAREFSFDLKKLKSVIKSASSSLQEAENAIDNWRSGLYDVRFDVILVLEEQGVEGVYVLRTVVGIGDRQSILGEGQVVESWLPKISGHLTDMEHTLSACEKQIDHKTQTPSVHALRAECIETRMHLSNVADVEREAKGMVERIHDVMTHWEKKQAEKNMPRTELQAMKRCPNKTKKNPLQGQRTHPDLPVWSDGVTLSSKAILNSGLNEYFDKACTPRPFPRWKGRPSRRGQPVMIACDA